MSDRPAAPDLVLIGDLVQETIYFPDRTVGPVLGSPPAYCAAVAAKLGARTAIISNIGPDMPEELLAPLVDLGVDLRGVQRAGVTTTTALIYKPDGRKEIRYPHKADPIEYDDIPPGCLAAQVIHVCPMDRDVPLETIRKIAGQPQILSVDLGGYGGAHSVEHRNPADAQARRALRDLVGCFTVVRASVEDSRHLFGELSTEPEAVARLFVDWGAEVGLVTLGRAGAVVATRLGARRVPALIGEEVDSTGAGDSFSAGFLVEYMRTGDALTAARFACAVALYVIQGTGGVRIERLPNRADVERRMEAQTVWR